MKAELGVGKHIIYSWNCSVIAVYIRIWRDKNLLTWWDNELRFCISCIAKFCVPRRRMITRSLDALRCKKRKKYFKFTTLLKVKAKQSHTTSTFSGLCFQVSSCWEENSEVVNILGVIYFSDTFSLQILVLFSKPRNLKTQLLLLRLVDQTKDGQATFHPLVKKRLWRSYLSESYLDQRCHKTLHICLILSNTEKKKVS